MAIPGDDDDDADSMAMAMEPSLASWAPALLAKVEVCTSRDWVDVDKESEVMARRDGDVVENSDKDTAEGWTT